MALAGLFSQEGLVSFFSFLVMGSLIPGILSFGAVFILLLIGQGIYNRYFHPLRNVPGPFWASISSLWLYQSIYRAKFENYQLPIHKKYGSIVRFAPNHVEFSDPAALESIYGPKSDLAKSSFYKGFDSGISTIPDSFSCIDSKSHDWRRRAVAPFYTQAAVLEYEPCVERIIKLFHQQMGELADTGKSTDMSLWLRKYTFDVIGELFYGREGGFGFLRENIDYNNWGKLMEVLLGPMTSTGYAPPGFKTLSILIQMLYPDSRADVFGFFEVIRQARDTLKKRLDDRATNQSTNSNDILNKLINKAQEKDENEDRRRKFSLDDVSTEIFAVIFAGADTTATALTAIFYYTHKNPEVLSKLRKEIGEAFDMGKLSHPIRFSDANKLPYLKAVVNEAMRIHPSTGLSLPRTAPAGGINICGQYIPGGTTVAMNAAVVQFDKRVYGEDSEEYIPERWIRDGDRAAANMERHLLQFGYGKRICLGKHISYIEMFKLIPTLLHEYDFELVGTKEWTVCREFFQHQKNVNYTVTRRNKVKT